VPPGTDSAIKDTGDLTIDELAAATGSTTRSIRSFQTMGLLEHPDLRGRTGVYGPAHLQRVQAILRLQARGFSLQSQAVLFDAHARGTSLAAVLDLREPDRSLPQGSEADTDADPEADEAELYGFGQLQHTRSRRRGRALLSIVPTTVWSQTEAS
jgi:DNA-binding transcriptional MerR regulator